MQKLIQMSQLTGSSRPLLVGELHIKEKRHRAAQGATEQLCCLCSLKKQLSILVLHALTAGLAGSCWVRYSQSPLCSEAGATLHQLPSHWSKTLKPAPAVLMPLLHQTGK